MATDIVMNAGKMPNPVRPVPKVLPLDQRVTDAKDPKSMAGSEEATQVAMEDADARTVWAACFDQPLPGHMRKGGGPPGVVPGIPHVNKMNSDAMSADGVTRLQEPLDSECAALAVGLMPALGNRLPLAMELPSLTAMQDGPGASPSPTAANKSEPAGLCTPEGSDAGREVHADAAAEVRASLSVSSGMGMARFDGGEAECPRERQTVLTQFSHDGITPAGEGDTLRFTYHFRSWQGQPTAMVSLNFHDSGRKLRVEAPDRVVYSALLANRDSLAGTLQILDDGADSRGRRHDQQEPGE